MKTLIRNTATLCVAALVFTSVGLLACGQTTSEPTPDPTPHIIVVHVEQPTEVPTEVPTQTPVPPTRTTEPPTNEVTIPIDEPWYTKNNDDNTQDLPVIWNSTEGDCEIYFNTQCILRTGTP